MVSDVRIVTVFADGPGGGNPAPVVVDAGHMSDADMQALARRYGYESCFVLPAPADSGCDIALRFWVPNHEMSMCGHATVGTVWLLDRLGLIGGSALSVWTASGVVRARLTSSAAGADGVAGDGAGGVRAVEITQPRGVVEPVPDEAVPPLLDALGITPDQLAPLPIQNARTSRVKTLVPVADVAVLDALTPRFSLVEPVCDLIGSTGLYPYAVSGSADQVFDARQFPQRAGYPEDAATGVAAAALCFGLLATGLVQASSDRPIRVRQGRAMGRPSQIVLRFEADAGQVGGVWLGGPVQLTE
jgi:PhzF family phenazine biosynthesis protein